jgi:cytochrome P450
MHRRYGAVVRIAPTEIDMADRDGYKEINRMGSGFVKSDWYPVFRSGVVDDPHKLDLFGLVDPKEHSKRRRMYAQNFSHNSIIQNWEPYIKARAGAAIAKIRDEARQGPSDVFN